MTTPAKEPAKPHEAPAEAQYELTASRRGLIKTYGVLKEHEGRLNDLPKIPPTFIPVTGTYAKVSAAAIRLNEAQERSGYLDYVYAPEPRKETHAA